MDNELIRKTVLEYLALRPTAAYAAAPITRMINLRGMADDKLTVEQVEAALTFLVGMDLVSMVFGDLGNSKNYQITAAGTLAYERGV